MNRSFSKIRHIQEANQRLERRFLMEQTDDDFLPIVVGQTNEFIPLGFDTETRMPKFDLNAGVLKFKVVSYKNGELVVNDGTKDLVYVETIDDGNPQIKRRFFCLTNDKDKCIVDTDGGLTKNGALLMRKNWLIMLGQDAENEILFNDNNFDEMVLKSPLPVLVDFSAIWCVPCLRIGKYLDEIKSSYKDKLVIGKLDIDISKQTPKKYEVVSVPVLMFFKDGKVIKRVDGAISKEELIEVMNSVL
jgi:thioredoxin 1